MKSVRFIRFAAAIMALPCLFAIAVAQSPIDISNNQCLGGSGDEQLTGLHITTDGGCILSGYSNSSDGDVTDHIAAGKRNEWIIKLDATGNIQWKKSYGGSNYDWA